MLESDLGLAVETRVASAGFGGLLGAGDTTVQAALATIDGLLTAAELTQLQNIGAATISATQWGYLGGLDQALAQASSPTFVGLTLSGALGTPTSITMAEDGWIGIGASSERIVFDGSGDMLAFTSTNVSLDTTYKVQFRDPQIYIASLADGYLDVVADGRVRIATSASDGAGWANVCSFYVNGTTPILHIQSWNVGGAGIVELSAASRMSFRIQTYTNIYMAASNGLIITGDTWVTNFTVQRTGDATGPGTQKDSFGLRMQASLWTGAAVGSYTSSIYSEASSEADGKYTMRFLLPSPATPAGLSSLELTTEGSVISGPRAALATNATGGFLYVPTCAGTPTGVPTAYTGKVAVVFDTTNNKLYVYDGGWIDVT